MSVVSTKGLKSTVEPVPYVGIQYVAIPEWAGIGTAAGQEFAARFAANGHSHQKCANLLRWNIARQDRAENVFKRLRGQGLS